MMNRHAFSEFLPDKHESRVLKIKLDAGKLGDSLPPGVDRSGALGGIIFQRFDANRTVLEWQIGLDLGPETAKLTVVCGVYSRWADISKKAYELIVECLSNSVMVRV